MDSEPPVPDDEDDRDEYVCGPCQNRKCASCHDIRCECCSGNP